MQWLDVAQELPQGQHTRIDCKCGKGKTLVVNNNDKYYSAHCFRCDYSPYHDKGIQTLAQLAHIKQLNEVANEPIQIELPRDFTHDIPIEGRLWLYKGGISPTVWKRYGIGYSPHMQRVVLPVYDRQGTLIWLQARAVLTGQIPKYIQPALPRDAIMFWAHTTVTVSKTVVVVEDILSAIRVGRHTRCVSLLGTKISGVQANRLSNYDRVITWLDDDKAGQTGAYKIRRTLGLLTDTQNICTRVDPKVLSNAQIIHTLKQAEVL